MASVLHVSAIEAARRQIPEQYVMHRQVYSLSRS